MKKLMTLTLPLFLSLFVFAQDLQIQSGSKGFYLVHKVAPKEGLFPLGRLYNVHPRHIAGFNAIDFNKGLAIGQMINIPLSDTNFKQNVNTGVPVYYTTTGKESLANISTKYKASMNNLRVWNKIKDDNVAADSKLIVGFLITNELKDKIVTITPQTTAPVEESVSNVKKVESQKTPVVEVSKEPEPKKEEPKKEESVSNVKKVESKKNPVVEVVKEPEPKKEEPKKTEPVVVKQTENVNNDGTGYFKNNFYQQIKVTPQSKEQTVTSAIFKTTSGWQDGKYYMLINGVEPGTIVKLSNPSNGKVIFAKVLYSMDRIRANQGVDIRISDAAAASLAINETDKFILKVNY